MPLRHLEERALDKYFDSIREMPLLTPEEERKNGHLWQDDRNPEGLRKLVEGNLRFVVKEARKFEGMGLDLLDLISEGNLGLIEAAKRFDPTRENKFLTYASWWVRQAIFHALAEHGSKIRLPQKVAGHLVQLNRLTHQLTQKLGRSVTAQEIAEAGHFKVDEVQRLQLLQQTTSTISTEQPIGETDLTVGDSQEQMVEPSAMQTLDQEAFLQQIQAVLGSLSEKERCIITLHFGLDDPANRTIPRMARTLTPALPPLRVEQLGGFERGLAEDERALFMKWLQCRDWDTVLLRSENEGSGQKAKPHPPRLEGLKRQTGGLSEAEVKLLAKTLLCEPLTLEEIGRTFQPPISRERVRQIEERAFMKIRDRRREVLGQFLRGEVT